MSRRDTIIIAVLVNAALLMILFATAIRSDRSKEDINRISDTKQADLAAQTPHEVPNSENILNEFVTSMPTLAEGVHEESVLTFEETELASLITQPVEIAAAVPVAVAPVEEVKPVKAKTEEQTVSVTVKKGDFLEKIAKANNTTVAAIMQANHMSSTQLKVGQVLKVPAGEGKKSGTKSGASSGTSSQGAEYYVVKEGDSPWLIASRNKMKLEDLLRLNGLDEQKAKRLRPGDKLKIR